MARLPIPGADNGTWGDVLNEYLEQSHKTDGTLKDDVVTADALAPNSVTSSAMATDAVDATNIADGSITEVLLHSDVQTKLNTSTPDWDDITNKPAVIAAGADQAAARTAIGFDDGLAMTTAHLPAVYLDPRDVADGPLTAMTKGQFDRSFGNNIMEISDGKIVHVQGAGGAGNNAGYLQALLSEPITRIGCMAYWPSGATGAVALVIPSARWDYPGLTDANVHFVIDGAGQITMGRFDVDTGTVIDYRQARVRGFTTGTSHRLETYFIPAENRVIVTVDGQRYLNFVDADYFTAITNYAVWELFESNNTIVPAQFLSVWADGTTDIIPPAASPELVSASPPALLDAIGATSDSSNATFTTSLIATYEDITIIPSVTFQYPESGKVLVRINIWAAVSGGSLLLRVNNTGGAMVAVAGFTGRINHEQVLTGTPGQNTGTVVNWQAYMTGGSTTFTKGGSAGQVTVSVIPVRF